MKKLIFYSRHRCLLTCRYRFCVLGSISTLCQTIMLLEVHLNSAHLTRYVTKISGASEQFTSGIAEYLNRSDVLVPKLVSKERIDKRSVHQTSVALLSLAKEDFESIQNV